MTYRDRCTLGSDAAEINVFNRTTNQVLVTNDSDLTIDFFRLSSDLDVTGWRRFDVGELNHRYDGVQSVAVNHIGIAVAAVSVDPVTDNGFAVFLDTFTLDLLAEVEVGALPDMVTFTNAGDKVLVANEGDGREYFDT